jgi:hypothetical protein
MMWQIIIYLHEFIYMSGNMSGLHKDKRLRGERDRHKTLKTHL